jgi:hypothetical protein
MMGHPLKPKWQDSYTMSPAPGAGRVTIERSMMMAGVFALDVTPSSEHLTLNTSMQMRTILN